ncbi:MAG TPA: fibronectin type III domain-containing protein, partial [Candidatus Dormibacteraeota bacterium]|nr:fibronectin type III domain-containing protein [Candidatus Dormibacteraeota bacterium]
AVPGANSYRVDKNSQPLGWISDTGQATYTAVDPMPCAKAFYTLVAMFTPSASVISQMSEPLQLQDSGQVTPWQNPVGSSMQMMITSYNDPGLTSVGYQTELGICAVDPRVIPWGTYFYVPGYGTCYSADIGTWIQGDIVDVWLPGTQASGWGVQSRSITYLARPTSPTPTPSPVTPPSAPSGITLTPNGGGQATLTWIAPTDNGGAPVTYYAIYLYPQMATPVVVTANPNSYSISGLNPNTYYVGTVTAYNGAGWSPWGGWSSWSFVT